MCVSDGGVRGGGPGGSQGEAWGAPAGSPDDLRCPGSSPHLVQVRERIRINGQPISPEHFTKHFWRLYHRLEETKVSIQQGRWGDRSGHWSRGKDPEGTALSGPHLPRAEAAWTSDSRVSTGQQQLCLHACILPLPHAHGLPCLPAREGLCPLPRALCLRPRGGES